MYNTTSTIALPMYIHTYILNRENLPKKESFKHEVVYQDQHLTKVESPQRLRRDVGRSENQGGGRVVTWGVKNHGREGQNLG